MEGVDAAVVTADIRSEPCSLWRLNVQGIESRYRNAMISSLLGGKPYESKYSAYPELEIKTATQCEPGMLCLSRLTTIIEGFISVDGKRYIG